MAWLSRNFIYFYSQGSSIVERCDAVCKGCTEALIRTGWLLDITRHTDINDIKSYGSGNTYCCWYYLKSRTGAKLLVYYGYYTCSIPVAQLVASNGTRGSNDGVGDLCLAMIPPGSSSEFGSNITLENPKFIPDDSTYLTGRAYSSRNVQSKLYSSSSTPMEWVFISDGETIAMFSTKTKKENYRLQLEFMNQTVDEQWRSIQQSQVCKCIQTIGDKVTMEPMELHTHVAALSVLKHSISQTHQTDHTFQV